MGKAKQGLKWFSGTIAAVYAASVLQNSQAHFEDHQGFSFPDHSVLNPQGTPHYTNRQINPLWAPTSYLQGIDCEKNSYSVKDLQGEHVQFQQYKIDDPVIEQRVQETSLGYSVYVNDAGHAVINFKAIGKLFEVNEHEQAAGFIKDVLDEDEQAQALELVINHLLNDENIKTMETVGYAQGSAKVYYLAEKYNILGTIISDTGTNFTSEKLGSYVVALDAPGDIHSFPFIGSTGENKPAHRIDLGENHSFQASQLYTPLESSWVEKIQTLAFTYEESYPPENYEDQGLTLLKRSAVCDNPSLNNE